MIYAFTAGIKIFLVLTINFPNFTRLIFNNNQNNKRMKKLLLSILAIACMAEAKAQLWMPVNSNLDTVTGIKYMSAVDTNIVWAIGYDGTTPSKTYNKFTRTTDGTNYVSGYFYPYPDTAFAPSNICAVNDSMAFIATFFQAGTGTPGQILRTIDGGNTWVNIADTNMYNGTANFPNMVHFWDVNKGWTMGDPNNTFGSGNEFEIWRTMNGGANWARVPGASIPNPLAGEYGTTDVYTTYGDHHIWFGTNKGRIFRSADTGATWLATQLTGVAGGVYGVAFRDSLHGMAWGAGTTAATNPPIVFRVTSNGGATWTSLNTTVTGVDIGWTSVDNIPGTNRYLTVGLNIPRSSYVTSITYDDGLTWTALEAGTTNAERMIELEVLDSTHAWAGNFSDNMLPFGMGGMAKYAGSNMATIGLKPLAETNAFAVYPNPSNGVITVKLDKIHAGSVIKITDIMGKEVYSTNIKNTSLNHELTIDISSFAKGVYLMNIVNGKSSNAKKLIIE